MQKTAQTHFLDTLYPPKTTDATDSLISCQYLQPQDHITLSWRHWERLSRIDELLREFARLASKTD